MLITAQQVVIGVAMGFILQMVFGALVVAGQTIATSMGLGFAATIDPQNGVQVPVISQFFLILATLVFLALNGHLVLIETIVESFYLWPIGAGPLPENLAMHTVTWIAEVFQGRLTDRVAGSCRNSFSKPCLWRHDSGSAANQYFRRGLPDYDYRGIYHDHAELAGLFAAVCRIARGRVLTDAGHLGVAHG